MALFKRRRFNPKQNIFYDERPRKEEKLMRRPRPTIPAEVRREVLERQGYRDARTGETLEGKEIEFDHKNLDRTDITPRNIQALTKKSHHDRHYGENGTQNVRIKVDETAWKEPIYGIRKKSKKR